MNGRADKRILMAAIALMLAPPSAAATAQEDRAVPVIPAEFRSVVRAVSPDRLVVTALDGRPIPVDIEYYVPSRFSLHQRGRYLGFAVDGHEANGYLMVDRSAPAHEAVAETGIAPTFSPDGLYFAAAEMSEAAFGNLEGLGVWQVLPSTTRRIFFTDAVPRAFEWRVEGWPRADCVALSAIDLGWEAPAGAEHEQAIREAPRVHYQVEMGAGVAFRSTHDRTGCGEDSQ